MKTWAALDNNNSPYASYRFGVALAGSPGKKMDKSGPVGGKFTSIAYTDADAAILNAAAKTMGVRSSAVGSKASEESNVNKKSPVAKIKKNKYGV